MSAASVKTFDPCVTCIRSRDDPIFRRPVHVVQPEHAKAGTFDARGKAVCPHLIAARAGAVSRIALLRWCADERAIEVRRGRIQCTGYKRRHER